MSIKFAYSDSLSAIQNSTTLLYGGNGTGKTLQASTWPDPLFIVPQVAINELKTVNDKHIPILTYKDTNNLKAKIDELSKAFSKKEISFKTLVFDNLSTAQSISEDEYQQECDSKDKDFSFKVWGKFRAFWLHVMIELHKWPLNKVWICHDDAENVFSLKGSSRRYFPDNCDMILYTRIADLGKKQEYRTYLKRCGEWTARVRLSGGAKRDVPQYIVDCNYQKLEELFKKK